MRIAVAVDNAVDRKPLDGDRRCLCLIGALGRGKPSVAASVARQQRMSKRLGAEFYFTSDDQDRSEGVVPVLAKQLASWGDRRLRAKIASAVDEDRHIAQRTLEEQFQKLIQEPLETLADDVVCPPLVILLNGFDECDNDCASRLLHLIGRAFATLPAAVKFIITSRPETNLLHHYDSEPLEARLHVRYLDLEEVEQAVPLDLPAPTRPYPHSNDTPYPQVPPLRNADVGIISASAPAVTLSPSTPLQMMYPYHPTDPKSPNPHPPPPPPPPLPPPNDAVPPLRNADVGITSANAPTATSSPNAPPQRTYPHHPTDPKSPNPHPFPFPSPPPHDAMVPLILAIG
ncbi:hypothetical protein FRB95_012224 [Tulasnella sp. JGI-2019a]|nr:hypothetical protein FRB95_012224 [Tulasnella sp. JGI-2019a]